MHVLEAFQMRCLQLQHQLHLLDNKTRLFAIGLSRTLRVLESRTVVVRKSWASSHLRAMRFCPNRVDHFEDGILAGTQRRSPLPHALNCLALLVSLVKQSWCFQDTKLLHNSLDSCHIRVISADNLFRVLEDPGYRVDGIDRYSNGPNATASPMVSRSLTYLSQHVQSGNGSTEFEAVFTGLQIGDSWLPCTWWVSMCPKDLSFQNQRG